MANRIGIWPSGTKVVWRPLSWGEYQKMNSLSSSKEENAVELYKLCRISGPATEKVTAGIVSWIYNYEMKGSFFSGDFQKVVNALHKNREWLSTNYIHAAQALIGHVFHTPFEEMKNWDEDTFLHRLVQAEFISGKPLDPVNNSVKEVSSNKRQKKQLTEAQRLAIERRGQRDKTNPHGRR